jgi:hypothetical protein
VGYESDWGWEESDWPNRDNESDRGADWDGMCQTGAACDSVRLGQDGTMSDWGRMRDVTVSDMDGM